jgi:SAM-dependent methyltransferase
MTTSSYDQPGVLMRVKEGLAWRSRHALGVGNAMLHTVTRRAFSSGEYWEARYRTGGTSGTGSIGHLAAYKAEFINAFVADNAIESVLDLGCGDGNLLSMLRLPVYVGVDASLTTLARCAERFSDRPNHRFLPPHRLDEVAPAQLAMSIDVIYHLVENRVFAQHMRDLFERAEQFVMIYASNRNRSWPDRHVRHRRFSDHVAARWPHFWQLLAHVPNRYPYDATRPKATTFADFFIYGRTPSGCRIRIPATQPDLPPEPVRHS